MIKALKLLNTLVTIYTLLLLLLIIFNPFFSIIEFFLFLQIPYFLVSDLFYNQYGIYILPSVLLLSLLTILVLRYIVKKQKPEPFLNYYYLGPFFIFFLIYAFLGYEFRYIEISIWKTNAETAEVGKIAGTNGSFKECSNKSEWESQRRDACTWTAVVTSGNRSLCEQYLNYDSTNYSPEKCYKFLHNAYELSASKFCTEYPKNIDGYSYECIRYRCADFRGRNFDYCNGKIVDLENAPDWCELFKDESVIWTCSEEVVF